MSDEVVFEKVDEVGEVVERIVTYPGSHSETEYGVLALESRGGWRYAPTDEPTRPPTVPSAPESKGGSASTKEGEKDGVRDAGEPRRSPGARPRAR